MTAPQPKSKLDEVSEVIYSDPDNTFLSEFQATRLERMTKEAESLNFLRAKKQRMLIYYQSGQYSKAKEELKSLVPYIPGNGKLYITLAGMAVRIGAFAELCKMSSKLDAEAILGLPKEYRVPVLSTLSTSFVFTGNFRERVMDLGRIIADLRTDEENFKGVDVDFLRDKMEHFSNIYSALDINSARVRLLADTVEEFIAKNKIRVLGLSTSLPDGEFLIDLGINKPVEEIIQFNNGLFDLVFERDIVEEFNAFSINFSPINEEQLKDVLV
ncbi:hypothetical protein [Acinetobacter johnsonii]|jgi:hypothetical protein|uniref:Tetratricopeptide repeat protein n=1 Tax=Acinetobacter johnsonii TaxID=40214 RepID=A0AAJ6IE99_ACIJO|nr:hypothetical protein [Acinetobacter johnsonii]ALV73076.1 hypothetical protein RZ95_09310 [Acinetobacter johnsonii XBB1]MDH1534041.1 hypothetical protein [Acinetobacter johnsonii]WMG17642.1 hypothetical protein QBJ73_14870 [Acinetobacter johnsonii]